ncbi:MAG: pyruvate kinase [Desulfocapsaceae bacterium]|nr:pyruvate kinase [Desulfocapsaceae bacterium]
MKLQVNKTKIIATIGPASDNVETLTQMIKAGMNIARLNFSHGAFSSHSKTIAKIREAARICDCRIAIMADLPGPKMRIGTIEGEPISLAMGDVFILTTEEVTGNKSRVSVSYPELPQVVKTGDILYLDDGFIQLIVDSVQGREVNCIVQVGGRLRSRKGLNLPGIDLGMSAFTAHDRNCLEFALRHGVDAISQSFVANETDLREVRETAKEWGYSPFIIAKIERSAALNHLDTILQAADGVMIARGDLGVEIPIEEMAITQKMIMAQAQKAGKPVITATQMLESMITNRRPTRAEATDVANAILDGTDCIMLSGESAMGAYPVEAVAMLASIGTSIENFRPDCPLKRQLALDSDWKKAATGLIALAVDSTILRMDPAFLIIPTQSGATARNISRFRHKVWTIAVSSSEKTCQELLFSYGVHPLTAVPMPADWNRYANELQHRFELPGEFSILTEGPSPLSPDTNHRMELIPLGAR